jgi:hypothetical protein
MPYEQNISTFSVDKSTPFEANVRFGAGLVGVLKF